jgi:hypothetical protein
MPAIFKSIESEQSNEKSKLCAATHAHRRMRHHQLGVERIRDNACGHWHQPTAAPAILLLEAHFANDGAELVHLATQDGVLLGGC